MRLSRPLLYICLLGQLLAAPALGAQEATSHLVSEPSWFPGSSSISEPEIIPPAYRGMWATSLQQCQDPDGVERIFIAAEGVDYYESGGRLVRITQAGRERSVRLKLSYEGEGQFWDAEEVWTLNGAEDRLTIESPENADESQAQIWVRCD